METWVDVGSPTDARLEAHLPPCPDDADFDAPPATKCAMGDHWDVILVHDSEIMALRKQMMALEKRLIIVEDILDGGPAESSEIDIETAESAAEQEAYRLLRTASKALEDAEMEWQEALRTWNEAFDAKNAIIGEIVPLGKPDGVTSNEEGKREGVSK